MSRVTAISQTTVEPMGQGRQYFRPGDTETGQQTGSNKELKKPNGTGQSQMSRNNRARVEENSVIAFSGPGVGENTVISGWRETGSSQDLMVENRIISGWRKTGSPQGGGNQGHLRTLWRRTGPSQGGGKQGHLRTAWWKTGSSRGGGKQGHLRTSWWKTGSSQDGGKRSSQDQLVDEHRVISEAVGGRNLRVEENAITQEVG